MGDALVTSYTGQKKPRISGGWGSVEQSELPIEYSLIATIADEDTLTHVDGSNTLTWVKPTLLGNGDAIPGSTITGYKVYRAGGAGEYRYAVATTYSGGQSALGNVVRENYWLDNLPAQTGSNTFDNTDSQATIQAYIDGLTSTGGTIYLDGTAGAWSFTTTGFETTGAFINITRAQTEGNDDTNYINIVGINNAIIEGVGTDSTPAGNQTLIDIGGSFVRIHNVTVKDSGKMGMNLHGSDIEVTECTADNCWLFGFVAGDENEDNQDCNRITIKHCIANNTRIGGGFAIIVEDNTNYNVDFVSFIECLSFRNGWARDNTMYEFLGGNSDGFVTSKLLHTNYIPGDHLDPAVTGRENRARNTVFGGCIAYWNADDGIDINTGNGSVYNGLVVINNAPSGNKGIKIFNEIYESINVCNFLASGSNQNIFGNTLFTDNQIEGETFAVDDVVTGSVSGATGTVVSFTQGTNVTDQGILELSGITGAFQSDDILSVGGTDICGISLAKPGVLGLGPTFGFEGRVNDSVATRSYGTVNYVGGSTINHNIPGALVNRGILMSDDQGNSEVANAVSWNNKAVDSITGITATTSILNDDASAPDLENVGNYSLNETLTGSTIEEKWRNLYWDITGHYMPTAAGNCDGTGSSALVGTVYHATAADDADNPSDPEDYTMAKWLGSAPHKGGVPIEYIRPPIVSIS